MAKTRLDVLVVEKGLADNTDQAQRMIMAGQVRANGQVIFKPASALDPAVSITVDSGPPFVSRGGEKLAAALQNFKISVVGLICADVGASTGGFSDCLLQSGAARVYAIDVGRGILDWKLRSDDRVVVMEATNARYVDHLPEPVRLVTIDASFISLKTLLPVVRGWLPGTGEVIALIKPQFEASREQAARHKGVIRDPLVHRKILLDLLSFSQQDGYEARQVIRSPLLGPKGNIEFLVHLVFPAKGGQDVEHLVSSLVSVDENTSPMKE